MILHYLLLAALPFIVTYLIIIPLRRLSHRFGWLDLPRAHKRHSKPIPFTGGWAVFIGFWLGVLLAYLLVPEFAAGLGQYLPGVFAAHLLIFLGGVVDDFVDLAAWLKLAIQATAAMILIASGLKIDTIYIPFTGSFLLGDLTYPATILWVLVIVNAVNIVDGLDGLAAGLSVITSIGLLYVGLTLQVPVVVGLAVILLGVLPAFLRFNYANASIFLGDSGAQSIGFVFAVAAIYFPIKSYTVVAMFVPLLSLGVPLVELALSFVRRLLVGKPVMAGDYGHLFHVLVKRGLSHRATVLVFYAVAVSLQIFVFTLFLFDRRVVFSILVLFMMVTAAWFLRLSRQEER